MKVFIDDSGWATILSPDAEFHREFRAVFEMALNNGDKLFTHNVAIGMATMRLKESGSNHLALRFNQIVEEAAGGGNLSVLWVSRRTQKEAGRLFKANIQLNLSVFDHVAYQMTSRRRINAIISQKQDYLQLGLRVLPEVGD